MNQKIEQINFITPSNSGNWKPVVKEETLSLLEYLDLPNSSRQKLIDETVEILSQCGNPSNSKSNEIGLAFGYVQSGKTMSFTTLAALAKDNGYRIIIVIAGISTNLIDQSSTRLEEDLRIGKRNDSQWLSFVNPKKNESTVRQQIIDALKNWEDKSLPEEDQQTILITVMKQKNHLPNLRELLEEINLNGVPVLIIDDEGDQHSMNGQNRRNSTTGNNRMSPIHRKIVDLRNATPHHSFIQYTATPQANLFQDIMDALSPKFIQLLSPGDGYTGGKIFFKERPELTSVINDIDPDQFPNMPPQSFRYAMMIFFLGVVKGKPKKEGKGNRSMMIHPSQLTFTHSEYERFVIAIKNNFIETLNLPNGNPDKLDLLEEFKIAYNDLASTTNDLPPFDEFTSDKLRHAIRQTVVQSLNGLGNNRTTVEWRNSYSWILIGGQAMDRGFTVKGLTVTYMPRGIGVRNSDTIQQRARFFGYKLDYLGYCRVFLDREARTEYENYIDTEEDMRRRLLENKKSGKPLDEWYREVFLSSRLNIARSNIFSKNFERSIIGGKWNVINTPHNSPGSIAKNQKTLSDFISNSHFSNTGRFPTINKSLKDVYDKLLTEFRFNSDSDVADYTALLYVLERHLEEVPEETCTLFLMSDFDKPRFRSLNERNQIDEYFQGRNETREGLRDIKGNGITFQVYVWNLEGHVGEFKSVVGLATFIPEEISVDLIRWV